MARARLLDFTQARRRAHALTGPNRPTRAPSCYATGDSWRLPCPACARISTSCPRPSRSSRACCCAIRSTTRTRRWSCRRCWRAAWAASTARTPRSTCAPSWRALTGQVAVAEPARHLVKALHEAGFLDDDVFAELRARKHDAFAARRRARPAHAGSGYPDEAGARPTLAATSPAPAREAGATPAKAAAGARAARGHRRAARQPRGRHRLVRRRVPRAARRLGDRTFVILGTSHYGEPDRFGLTRKPFATPFGAARTDGALVDALAAPPATPRTSRTTATPSSTRSSSRSSSCSTSTGLDVRILPILCGAFIDGPCAGARPRRTKPWRASSARSASSPPARRRSCSSSWAST